MAASSKTSDFETFRANLQKAILETTNLARHVPAPEDLQYQRTLSRPLGKKVDQVSKRLLHITSRVLDLAKQGQPANDKGKKSARSQGELQEEDVIDAYQARIVNVTDQLLEQIDANLDQQRQSNQQLQQQSSTNTGPVASTSRAVLPEATATSASSHYNFRNAGDIAKPQALFNEEHNNARDAVFKPLLSNKPHALVPLDNTPVTHEDPESGKLRTRIPNPYAHEIQAVLQKPFPELDNPYDDDTADRMSSQMDSKPYTFVDSPEKLAACLAHLKKAQVVAIDLEHHELRTFRGVTCLMQISTIEHDFIVDPLVPDVRSNLHTLNEVTTNPDIIKVLHGAESDIIWLQRDFGIYIVNLFDTYHTSKVLNRLTGHSLASLLKEYTTFLPDKKYQLADWRIRPLTPELVKYARSDTHFLIYIFFALLKDPAMDPGFLQDIRVRSARFALQVYEHGEYDAEQGYGSGGWRRLADRSGKLQTWGIEALVPREGDTAADENAPWRWFDKQGRTKFEVFRALHAWRDQVAREDDESTGYILPNKTLIAIAEALPKDMQELAITLGKDLKGVAGRKAKDILQVVAEGKQRAVAYLAEQEAMKPAEQRDTSKASTFGLWTASGAPQAGTNGTQSIAAPSGFSQRPLIARDSSLFGSREPSTGGSSSRVTGKFSNAVKKVHRALLEQLQPASAAILGSNANDASAVTKEHAVKAEVEDVKPVKSEKQENDIIQVNSSRNKSKGKKRKSPDTVETKRRSASPPSASTSKNSKKLGYVKPFDYTSVKSVLDAPIEDETPRKRPKKGGRNGQDIPEVAGSEGPTFKRPPKSMNQPKSGNKSHTFL